MNEELQQRVDAALALGEAAKAARAAFRSRLLNSTEEISSVELSEAVRNLHRASAAHIQLISDLRYALLEAERA